MRMPKICNRVATEWKKVDQPCECSLWPAWLKSHMGTKVKRGGGCFDVKGKYRELMENDKVCFWRQGKDKKRWWYDGIVAEVVTVIFPTGQVRVIVGIN